MMLELKFNQDEFSDWIEEFLPDFSRDARKVEVPTGFSDVKSIKTLGESSIGVRVFIIETLKDPSGRKVGLAKDSFNLIKNYGTPNALIVYYSENSDNWRFSLLTSTPIWNDGKIITKLSNPKRHSYVLGPNAKVNTPTKFLIKKEEVLDFIDLKSRFSLEVVNKEFYKEISESFTKLVGGTRGEGKNKKTYESLLDLPSTNGHSQISIEFAVRLIGRVIFCWFLKEKMSVSGNSLMPKELLSLNAISDNSDYYHKILEPIFFEVLNKPIKSRKDAFASKSFSQIPYLNGGLFSPHDDDFFSYNEGKQAQFHNTVVVPDEWFKEFFGILETYNFTIDENTSIDEDLSIDPEMLGRIFENLLAEINPETGESARKSTGSYYTPRVIVDYMVDESLLLYLKQKTDIDEEKLRAIISYDLSDDSSNPLNDDEKHWLVDAIEEVKILDPACGSGAFPIGALQKIVFILQQADPDGQIWFQKQIKNTSPEIRRVIEREFLHKNFDYLRKLGIIRENIYGIDIQPIATEISRLRCFLTLVVDERIDESLENRGVEPLPNLDFKFVTANSLIRLPASNKRSQIGLFEDTEGISELREIRDMFFNAYGTEREQLKLQFVQTQNRMFQKLITENRRGHAELTTMLTTWDPFSHKSSKWFDSEWMFGNNKGFNIVIANPPYVQIQKLTEVEKESLMTQQYNTFSKSADLYCLFYECALNLQCPQGILTFISSNKFLRSGYGKKLRKLLGENTELHRIIDFGELPVFSAGTDPCIILAINQIPQNSTIRAVVVKDILSIQNIQTSLIQNGFDLDRNALSIDGWTVEGKSEIKFLDKLRNTGTPLGKYVNLRFYRGILTGLNDAFIINRDVRERLIDEDHKSIELIQPWLSGVEIKRWYANFQETYIINILSSSNKDWPWSGKDANEAEAIFQREYPSIYTHLKPFREKLITRDDQGKFYWELRSCTYTSEYLESKIVFNETSKELHAMYDEDSLFINKTGFIIVSDDSKYLLGVLNSKLMDYFYRNTFPSWGDPWKGGRIQFRGDRMNKIPIPNASSDMKFKIVTKVDNILSLKKINPLADVHALEEEVDQIVYDLYDLTNEEIKIVEGEYRN